MKKFIFVIAFITFNYNVFAQAVDLRRRIEVTGTAEQSVTPDVINVSINLKEYMNGRTKVDIYQLEKQLEDAVNEAGIPKADFTISNISSWNYNNQKKKNPDFLASKQYAIKFHDLNKFDQIISKIDPKGIQSTNIDSYDYSKIDQLKEELKLKALLSAKEKAKYLLTGIGEQLGGPISITENDNSNYPMARPMMLAKTMSLADNNATPESDIDLKQIKLSFQINAVFEIK